MLGTFKLWKIRKNQQHKFNEQNLMLYKYITAYIQNTFLSSGEKEEILQQILDMMLQAQYENKPVSNVIGNNYESFCDSVILEYTTDKSTAYKILNYIEEYFIYLILIMLIFVIALSLLNFNRKICFYATSLIVINAVSLYMTITKNVKKKPIYKTICGKIKFRFYKYKDNNSIGVLIYTISLIVPLSILGPFIIDYSLNFYEFSGIIICSLLMICAIEVYKRVYKCTLC